MLKRLLLCALCVSCSSNVFSTESDSVETEEAKKEETLLSASDTDDINEKTSEFQELSEPYRYISGAYAGIGIGYSSIPLNTDITHTDNSQADADKVKKFSLKKRAGQPELGAVFGFGGIFQKDYYAGLEFEFSKRFSKHNTKSTDDENFSLVHNKTFGLGMCARFGYQLPLHSTLIYGTIGFVKLRGGASIKRNGKEYGSSYGTYSPTIGLGVEHRINYNWNLRVDARYSIPKKKNKTMTFSLDNEQANPRTYLNQYKYKGKVSKVTVKFYVTRSF